MRVPRPNGAAGGSRDLAAAVTRALESAGLSYLRVRGASDHAPGTPAPAILLVVTGDPGTSPPHRLSHDGVTIDLEARTVDRLGTRVHLSRREWTLLRILVDSDGRPVRTTELLARLGDPPESRGALYATVHRLRRKIEPDPGRPAWITTVPGVGLRLCAPPP